MTRLMVLAVLGLTAAGCKAPKCEQRKKALQAIVADEDKKRVAARTAPVTMRWPNSDELDEAAGNRNEQWKSLGVQLMVLAGSQIEAVDLQKALKLAATASVRVCVQKKGPVVRKYSLDADEKLVSEMMAKIADLDPADRATVIAGEFADRKWSCDGIPNTFTAVARASPSDRLTLLAGGVVDSFDDCNCPRADVEPAYAALTLMADVWDEQMDCAEIKAGGEGAQTLKLKSGFTGEDLLVQLKAAGAAGVTLPPAQPN
ncbi:MAG: hypothetical protein U0228_16150 [Myxococcaceae bacterium]